ncbi:MAG: hypothetical protein Pg6C_06000 [Treponemataceae bacterium]|nr:MAG: hypothetical protein Pg6C_06000 [Treponemataceae bacterium]
MQTQTILIGGMTCAVCSARPVLSSTYRLRAKRRMGI